MPITLKIVEGPPFKKFLFLSMVITDNGWLQGFTFQSPKGVKEKRTVTVSAIGQFPVGAKHDGDTYSFIAHRQGDSGEKWMHFFYVGSYNVRSRVGECECYTQPEFIKSPVAKSFCLPRQLPLTK